MTDQPAPRSDPDHPAQLPKQCQSMTLISLYKYSYSVKQWLIGLRQGVTLIILHNYPNSAKQWLWSACTNTHIVLSNDWSACAKQWSWSSCTNTVPNNDSRQPAQIHNMLVPTHRRKRDNFCAFLFAFNYTELYLKWDNQKERKLLPREANSFFLELSKCFLTNNNEHFDITYLERVRRKNNKYDKENKK